MSSDSRSCRSSGRDGLLSARAVAAQQSSIPIVVTNTGTAPADNVALAATAPTGWKVTFEPSTIDRLVPGKDTEVQALVTPSDKSLAGDYMTVDPRDLARRERIRPVPDHGRDLDGVGNGRRRRDRRGAAADAGRGCEVWTPMSDADNKAVTAADNIVIAARGLTKRYGDVNVVDAINFDIAKGEVFGLLGPNGAGKTTTILMMLGLTEISAGVVSVLGYDPARAPLQVKRRVGYLPDSVGFYDHLTARREPRLYRQADGSFGRRSGRGGSRRRWRGCGLADVADKRVATFSRGMRQRLGLAEIIVKQAEIAILDEPTSGLDPQATLEFLEPDR